MPHDNLFHDPNHRPKVVELRADQYTPLPTELSDPFYGCTVEVLCDLAEYLRHTYGPDVTVRLTHGWGAFRLHAARPKKKKREE